MAIRPVTASLMNAAHPLVRRTLIGLAIVIGVLGLTVVALLSISNWNWLREPIARQVETRTGRSLGIGGDLEIHLGWPNTRVQMAQVTFANPPWAHGRNMFSARNVRFDLAVPPLFRRAVVFERVELDRAVVSLEKSADGRKNWLLDRRQSNDRARVDIRHLAVRDGRIRYRDPAQKTLIDARIATRKSTGEAADYPLAFEVSGRYKGQALEARGGGGSVLSLRDSSLPYPLHVQGRVGQTAVSARGRITNLLKFSALDLDIRVRGDSLARLYPLLGIVFPDTPPYSTHGRLQHAARWWRYDRFSGKVGRSDIAGSLRVDNAGARPELTATLSSSHLDLADLGPLVGASSSATAPDAPRAPGRVLPDTPFRTARWGRMNADVRLKARSIKRADALPISDLNTRLRLRDAVVTLDPLEFGVAGGTLAGTVTLDGRHNPIRARARLDARKINLVRLFPSAQLDKTSFGQINGRVRLQGRGDTIAAMLGTADGEAGLVVNGGEISKLMMETVSLHLLEILQLKLTGDESVRIRCGIADFGVKQGVMDARSLVLDTDIVRIDGQGRIDLGEEQLALTIEPKTKKLSLVALRTPIHVEGSFRQPDVSLDKGKLALRGLGAIALGAVNPALALMPLIDSGSAEDSDCRRLIAEARPAPAKSR